jgi:lipid-binding SYLF domain-containing protein
MKHALVWLTGIMLVSAAAVSIADEYTDAAARFRNAGQSAAFFNTAYGYAIFPTIGKGGLVVGGARGTGRVFVRDQHVGDATMTQLSVGLQAGGQAYSQIIFFEDERAFNEFTSGNFEFGADASAVAITAAAGAGAGTTGGPTAHASDGQNDARTAGKYYRGFAVFTIVKGGAMVSAAIAGQKFTFQKTGG